MGAGSGRPPQKSDPFTRPLHASAITYVWTTTLQFALDWYESSLRGKIKGINALLRCNRKRGAKEQMRMRFVVKRMLPAILAVIVMVQVHPAAQATEIGAIDFQRALADTAEMRKNNKEIEAKYRPRQEQVAKLSQEIQELEQKLQQAAVSDMAALQDQLARKRRDAQRKQEDTETDFRFEMADVFQAGTSRMRFVVAKLADEKGLDLVIDVQLLTDPFSRQLNPEQAKPLYLKPALDMTAEATSRYDQEFPLTETSGQ